MLQWGKALGLVVVFFIVMGVLAYSPIGDLIEARLLEAKARQVQASAQMLEVQTTAQAQMLEAKSERLQLFPLVLASVKDSLLVLAFVVFNQVVLVGVIVYLVKELKAMRREYDHVSMSRMR
jgi:hypothetical protein